MREARPIGNSKSVVIEVDEFGKIRLTLFNSSGNFILFNDKLSEKQTEVTDLAKALVDILGDKLPMCCGANCQCDNPHRCSDLCRNGPQKA